MENYTGKRLDGRYEMQEIVGVGGMAVVYKAYDNIDDRIVAVKVLKDEYLANEEFRRRFKNESKAIAVLSHPNIVKVYDVSYGDKLQYIVMEYVEGITLKEYIQQQGAVNWHECVKFLVQILRALQHAHDKGIVHRDIKPQNIMLLQHGIIKIGDFGIARFSRSETRTMTENAIGSVHYISPEQARGDLTDEKADIYSVGVVMYEMLTGQLPFESDSAVAVALMQVQQDPQKPREINPNIPVGLEQITMRAMQKNAADRYQSAAEMLPDLDEFKRNPSIKFDYTYYVDKQPTKYADDLLGKLPVPPKDEDKDDDDGTVSTKPAGGRMVPIMLGVALGLLVVAGIVIMLVMKSGMMNDNSRLEVENFIGKNYYEDIEPNLKTTYEKYNFETVLEANSQKEDGEIIRQSPSAGTKIVSDDVVTLTIISNSTVDVPDVYGNNYSQAQQKLIAAGFAVTIEQVQDSSHSVGTVISTQPEKGAKAPRGSTVKLLVAIKNDEVNDVVVPNLVGWSLSDAIDMLEAAGLMLDTNYVYINSEKDIDTVLDQSVAAGSSIAAGSYISLTLSNGYTTTLPPSTEATSSTDVSESTDTSSTDETSSTVTNVNAGF